jgi:hypothetical protein
VCALNLIGDHSHLGYITSQVSDGFFKAIKRAKDFFLSDSYNFFRERNVMFKSICVTPDGVTTECLVYPLISGEPSDKFGGKGQSFGLIYPPEKVYETHMMKYEDKEYKARQVVIVKDDLGHQGDVDPFDFRWSSGTFFSRLTEEDAPSAESHLYLFCKQNCVVMKQR